MSTAGIYAEVAGAPIGYHARDLSALRRGVSVFVASLNTRDALELTIRSAKRLPGRSFDLYVGDSGSTDGSLAIIEHFRLDGTIRSYDIIENRPHWQWLDHWRQTCPTRYAVFVDSDMQFLRGNWLEALLECADDQSWAMVGGEIVAEQQYCLHNGVVPFRFAARLSPWLLLLDIERCDPVPVSFKDWSHPSAQVPEGRVAYDVSGTLFHSLLRHGIACGALPVTFQQSYRHYGGLSWRGSGSGRQRVERRLEHMTLKRRLQRERRR